MQKIFLLQFSRWSVSVSLSGYSNSIFVRATDDDFITSIEYSILDLTEQAINMRSFLTLLLLLCFALFVRRSLLASYLSQLFFIVLFVVFSLLALSLFHSSSSFSYSQNKIICLRIHTIHFDAFIQHTE